MRAFIASPSGAHLGHQLGHRTFWKHTMCPLIANIRTKQFSQPQAAHSRQHASAAEPMEKRLT